MVGYSKDVENLTPTDYMLCGAFSGIVTRLLCQPLDVIKIRFQLQVEPVWRGSTASKYRSNWQAARTILQEEGIRGLWKGHNPGQLLSILYGIGQFGSFEFLTKAFNVYFGYEKSSSLHFVCGSVAGVIGTVVSYPFDVIRTRFIAQGNNVVYKNMYGGTAHMLKFEGPTALFKGMTPTLLQVAPHAGAQFAFYNLFSQAISNISFTVGEDNKLNFSGSIVSGSLAGLCAKTVVYPFDLTRKRLELQGFQKARTGYGQNFYCEGMVNCFMKTFRNEGVVGLFKGLSPSLVKAGLTSALHFTVYEQASGVLAALKSERSELP